MDRKFVFHQIKAHWIMPNVVLKQLMKYNNWKAKHRKIWYWRHQIHIFRCNWFYVYIDIWSYFVMPWWKLFSSSKIVLFFLNYWGNFKLLEERNSRSQRPVCNTAGRAKALSFEHNYQTFKNAYRIL